MAKRKERTSWDLVPYEQAVEEITGIDDSMEAASRFAEWLVVRPQDVLGCFIAKSSTNAARLSGIRYFSGLVIYITEKYAEFCEKEIGLPARPKRNLN